MDEQRYLINGRIFAAHDPGLQEALARVHGTPARPRCLCVAEGVEMYVSKFSDFVIKRMPETGAEHRPTCPSYELPASESGLGEVLGEAIIERGPEGVELRLDFPLTRRIGRSFATAELQPAGRGHRGAQATQLARAVALPLGARGHCQVQQKWTRPLPIKSSRFRGVGCPFLSAVDGQNERRVSICSQFGKHHSKGVQADRSTRHLEKY